MFKCEDCGNDDRDRMCMGICVECGGEIVDVEDEDEDEDTDD